MVKPHHLGAERSIVPFYGGGYCDLERETACLEFLGQDVADLGLESRLSSFPSLHTPRREPDRGVLVEKGKGPDVKAI